VTDRAETLQTAYDSSERELVELRAAAIETYQAVEEGEAQAGSSLASRLRALGRHVSRHMLARFTWASRRPLAWCGPTTR
jgi:hypothetical protein